MKKPNNIERDINRIRLAIYEETKHMTPEQRAARVNKIGEAAAKQYGFKVVVSAKEERTLALEEAETLLSLNRPKPQRMALPRKPKRAMATA